MSTLFDDTNIKIDPNKDYSAELVGEGKKFKDVATLARSKVESDAFIGQLQTELQNLREDLSKRVTLEEVLTKINQNKQVEPGVHNQNPEVNPAPTLTKEQLEALINDQVAKRIDLTEAERSAKANFDIVIAELKKTWGDDFQRKLEDKRAELGLGKEWMTQLAGAQPKAFLSLVGVNAPAGPSAVSPFDISPSGINTSGLASSGHSGEKKHSFYQKMRATDPVKYNSKAVQMEIYNQAIKLGEAFFDV